MSEQTPNNQSTEEIKSSAVAHEVSTEAKAEVSAANGSSKNYILPVGFFAIILAIAVFTGVHYFGTHAEKTTAAPQPKFVVLNVQTIVTAYTKQLMDDKSLTPDQANELSKKVAANMKKIANYYRNNGYVVLNANSMVTWPANLDITKITADQLGIKM